MGFLGELHVHLYCQAEGARNEEVDVKLNHEYGESIGLSRLSVMADCPNALFFKSFPRRFTFGGMPDWFDDSIFLLYDLEIWVRYLGRFQYFWDYFGYWIVCHTYHCWLSATYLRIQ